MSDENNKGFTTAEYPVVASKDEALKLIYSMYHGQTSLENCINRLAITDWSAISGGSTVTRPTLDYTA